MSQKKNITWIVELTNCAISLHRNTTFKRVLKQMNGCHTHRLTVIYIYIYIYICIYIVCITIICYMIGYILLLYTLESKPMYISVEKAMLHINAIYSMLHIYRAIWPSPECWTYIQKWNLLLSYILCVYAYSLYTFLVLYICTLLIHIAICIYVVLI